MMIVKGKTYRTNPPGILKLSTLRAVKRDFGFNWPQIMAWFDAKDEKELDGATTYDLMMEPEFEAWVYAWVINADGVMSRAEFEALEISDIEFRDTAEDAAPPTLPDEPPDPTTASDLTGSGQGGAEVISPKSPRKASTKTSKKRSAVA